MADAKIPTNTPLGANGARPTLPWATPRGPAQNGAVAPEPRAPVTEGTNGVHALQQVKGRVHRKLLERLNLSNLDRLDRQQVADAVRKVVQDLITQEGVPLNFEERDAVVVQVLDEIFGLGPLEPLIKDPEVSDILVNTYKQVYIERHGKLERTEVMFQDDRHLLQVIDRIVSAVGRRIDDSSPWWTPACRTAPASTPSSGRSRWTGPISRSVSSSATRCRVRTCSGPRA